MVRARSRMRKIRFECCKKSNLAEGLKYAVWSEVFQAKSLDPINFLNLTIVMALLFTNIMTKALPPAEKQ